MSERRTDDETRAESLRVRSILLATRGARVCPAPCCSVITQDGREGERQHLAVVHGTGTEAQPR